MAAIYKLSDLVITNGGSSFKFEARKIDVTYFRQLPDGSSSAAIQTTWDFAANEPF